ncbi:P-loop containing nucleoside triphosphate hydrolase protein [Blyttiomyces helicus]|uniref:DNA 3'-5' helicase n=1 Tax=Blyttiomyces helicus TaxID=388810 RepID=A0A4P9WD54_9FUNG|nr:P-loop containing nucleoside triphosphate hydrolase protein [Blyttiomyces helicus]|eukprot:RKO89625.1 P-loop containing nucleoside triphosphate hydrolase protein [Blyttiomyces helicus]
MVTLEDREENEAQVVQHLLDYTFLPLKPDHRARPLWVCDDGLEARIMLEAFSPLAAQAQDFLITIAEPVSRPARMLDFKLTSYSLYAAVAVGMETGTRLEVLERFSKVEIPDRVVNFIRESKMSYGKVKLVLKDNSYPDILRKLLLDTTIARARVIREDEEDTIFSSTRGPKALPAPSSATNGAAPSSSADAADPTFSTVITLHRADEAEDGLDEEEFTHSFEIDKTELGEVKRRCIEVDYPLMEEYDFRYDVVNPNLDINLSPKTVIRDYQEKSLSKMFGGGGGRARSGIIVLPTGAGKTLVGITAACTVKKSTLVLCTNALSVEQWANEFRNWTSIKEGQIAKFTADDKKKFVGSAGIVVSTYTMISHSGKRVWETAKMIEWINSFEWGLLILDEVHVVPAQVFRRVLETVAAHTKLGLTATLVREDDKIENLNYLVGPKLYEANWMDLAGRGHIAKVEATEIWCPMTGAFYSEYMASKPGKRRLLFVMNPSKFMTCQYLIQLREAAQDKIIVFSDNVFALRVSLRDQIRRLFIYGQSSHAERTEYFQKFREGHPSCRTIFLSKVGDTSLDLPEATCLIQISSQFGSRFFTFVSRDTDEVQLSAKRRRFLVDQWYEFKVIPNIEELILASVRPTLHYSSPAEQADLLRLVQEAGDGDCDDEQMSTSVDDLAGEWVNKWAARGANKAKLKTEEAAKREAARRRKAGNSLFKAWRKGK